MLATNPSPGLSQFSVNLLHGSDPVNLRNCSPPANRSLSPKSADDNVSGSSVTTTSSPATTPALVNNNNNSIGHDNNNEHAIKEERKGLENGITPDTQSLFENISLLTQGNFWGNALANNSDPQAFMDAALYAMTAQPLGAPMRDPEVLQQFLKQHALLQRQLQGAAGSQNLLSSMQCRPRAGQPVANAVPSSSSNNNSIEPAKQTSSNDSFKYAVKTETSPSSDKKRGYPYTFQYCVLCQKNVHSSKLPCHIRQCHVGKPMFQCPACDFTSTYSKNNVKSHMVSLHGITGDPISYMDDYAEQVEEFMKKCFPNVRGRARPFPGRSQQNGFNQNSNRQAAKSNRQSLQRPSAPSPKANSERTTAASVSPSSLLLPNFNMFSHTLPQALEKTSDASKIGIPEIVIKLAQEEAPGIDTSFIKEEPKCPLDVPNTTSIQSCAKSQTRTSFPSAFPEHDQAVYTTLPHRFVPDSAIKGTVFETFTNSSDLIDRIDLSEMALIFENNRTLLSASQISAVAEIRKQLPKKDFEIMFALYKCDTTLLSLHQVQLIKTVAPSEVDVRRFKTFRQANSTSSLSDEEKFVIELSDIEQLYARLRVMELIHTYPETLFNLHQEIAALTQAASFLRADNFFASILQSSTIYANFVCGDLGAQMIHGVRTEDAIRVCKFRLPSGASVGKKVADMLAMNSQDVLAKRICFYAEACKYTFSTLERRVEQFMTLLIQLEAERAALNVDASPSSASVAVEEARLREALQAALAQMNETMRFFAEKPVSPSEPDGVKPEEFLKSVAELFQLLAGEL